jgi:hypothetical protein
MKLSLAGVQNTPGCLVVVTRYFMEKTFQDWSENLIWNTIHDLYGDSIGKFGPRGQTSR